MSSASLGKSLKKNILPLISKVIEEGGNYALTRTYIESYPGQIIKFEHKIYTDRLLEMNKQGQWMGGKTLSRSEVTKIVEDVFNKWKESEERSVVGYKKDLFLPGTGKETVRVTKERFAKLRTLAQKKTENGRYLTAVCRNYYYMQQFTSKGKQIKLNLIRQLNDLDDVKDIRGPEGAKDRSRFNFKQDLGHGAGEGIAASGLAASRAVGKMTNHRNKIVRDVIKKEKYMTEILDILVGYEASLEHATDLSDKKFFKDYELVLTTQDSNENKGLDASQEKALLDRLRALFDDIILEVSASKSLLEMVNEQFFSYFEQHKNLQVSGTKGKKKLNSNANATEKFKARQKSPVPTLLAGVKFQSKNITKAKKSKHRNTKRGGVNPLGMLMLLNKKLPEKVQQKMGLPGLTNRTGKFAQSAKAINITDTNEGVPVIDYTYETNPYQIFETGKGQKPWSTMQRDPRTIIDRSIRELAAEMALGKFTTRRV